MATDIPDKYIVRPHNEEVEDVDTVLRRIVKRQQVNEEGNVKLTAFLLRKALPSGFPENQISVYVKKIGFPKLSDRRDVYCELVASDIRSINVGVWHNPSDHPLYKNSHGSLCGRFDEQKALNLSVMAKVLKEE